MPNRMVGMGAFHLVSDFQPQGDQPQAIENLVAGLKGGHGQQVLLGVTGAGKTFTMANVIAAVDRPAIVIAHNKTLAVQLIACDASPGTGTTPQTI